MLILLVACAAPVDQSQIDDVLVLTGDPDAGAQVYEENCVECHDDDGRGMKGASLPEEVPATTDDDLVATILSGPSIMPNFVNRLDNQQVADVFSFLRQKWGEYDPG